MNSRDFCFWLQGLFELGNPEALDRSQVDAIKAHLALVFKHDIGTDGKCDHAAPAPTRVTKPAFPYPHGVVGTTLPDGPATLIC